MGSRPTQQLLDETAAVALTELERAPRCLANAERLVAPGVPQIAPAHDRTRRTLEQPCDFLQGPALVQQAQGSPQR
jgi:hypothetical protein